VLKLCRLTELCGVMGCLDAATQADDDVRAEKLCPLTTILFRKAVAAYNTCTERRETIMLIKTRE
jgi:hypothetical protein